MKENIFKFFDKVILADSLNEKTSNAYTIIKSLDKLIELLNSEYSEALQQFKNGKFIYRGAKNYLNSNDLAVIVTPGIRVSKDNVPNIYTILTSELFYSWKKFPRRNRSHICSLNLDTAKEHGDISYYVFPKNDTNIGVCPDSDIWYSFRTKYNRSADTLSHMLFFIFTMILDYDIDEIKESFNAASNTFKLFTEFDKKLDSFTDSKKKECIEVFNENYDNNRLFSDFIKFVEKNNKSDFLQFIEKNIFSSKDFKVVNISNLSTIINNYKEVWFEGPAIYIPTHYKYFKTNIFNSIKKDNL